MSDSTTMTIRVTSDLKDKLDLLADRTRRSRSFLAAEAVEAYVRRELEIVEGIRQGLDDVRGGRIVAHDEVAAEARSIIRQAKRQ